MTLNRWIIEFGEELFEFRNRKERTQIIPWGKDVVRVISTPHHAPLSDWSHSIKELDKSADTKFEITQESNVYRIQNNNLTVEFDGNKLSFFNKNKLILKELYRGQSNVRRTIGIDEQVPIIDEASSSLNISPHQFITDSYNKIQSVLRFEGDRDEQIYGMGGYQEKKFNKNLSFYELMHRNSQTAIPYYLSNKKYGFIWNNASNGDVTFAANEIKWQANNTNVIDYFVIIGENPKEIHQRYAEIVGKPPMIDAAILGLWQSKLRYQTLDELKDVYHGYLERKIPLSVLVIDYFHWTEEGNFEFDNKYWNGINSFAEECFAQGTQLMVSLWPTVNKKSKYYALYQNEQMTLKSLNFNDVIFNDAEILDFSNPKTVVFIRDLIKKNYKERGIKLFWADQAEPEMNNYKHGNYESYEGNFEKYGMRYPYYYTKAIQTDEVKKGYPLLVRSAWFNSQKYGALAWSGDIESSFDSLQRQIQIGLSMSIAGIPWWTSDIAGFHSGDSTTENFKELLIRWFQFATFSPILRMHGDRQPHSQKIGVDGGGLRTSGGPNEIWSFGPEVERILTKFIKIRERLRPYLEKVYYECSQTGLPIMRPVFYEYPDEEYDKQLSYFLGGDLLIYPIVEPQIKTMEVILPGQDIWINIFTGEMITGNQKKTITITLDEMPVFVKKDLADKIFLNRKEEI